MNKKKKTVDETALALGVCKQTVFNLLREGKLKRAPAKKSGGKGRRETGVTFSSILEYTENRRRSKL